MNVVRKSLKKKTAFIILLSHPQDLLPKYTSKKRRKNTNCVRKFMHKINAGAEKLKSFYCRNRFIFPVAQFWVFEKCLKDRWKLCAKGNVRMFIFQNFGVNG